MKTLRLTTATLLLLAAASANAADKIPFDLLNGKGIKTATCTVSMDRPKGTLKARSVTIFIDALKGSRTLDYVLDKDGMLTSTDMSTSTEKGQSKMTYIPSKTHDKLEIAWTKNGSFVGTTTIATANPNYTIAFPDDPGLWQVFLDSAVAHPHSDNIYTLFFPATTPTGSSRTEPVRLSSATEANGTLDGKPVVLKEYTLTFIKGKTKLYTDADGKLMMADVTNFGSKMVRSNFLLTK